MRSYKSAERQHELIRLWLCLLGSHVMGSAAVRTSAPTKIPSCTPAPMKCAMSPDAMMKRKISTMPPATAMQDLMAWQIQRTPAQQELSRIPQAGVVCD